ncbi:MAG: hypothetical protein GXP29_15260, partial [Planctomycetes bacterium]|nr:hypothetical protein [Planctomycetota bacterium]
GIRNSYLLQELFNLSFAYEPTRKALADRAEAAGLRLRSGNSRETDVADLVTFGQMTNSEGLAIDVYDAVVAKDPNSKSVKLFDPYLFNMRVGAKRYADIVASSDVDKDIALRLKHFAGKTSPLTEIFSSDDAQKNAMQKAEAFERLMGYYQAFVGLADHTRAADLAAKVLKIDGNPNVLNGLAWSGYLSGKATETNVQQAEEALKASGGASIDVIDTLVRVLHQMGRKEEAVNRCRAALAKAETEMEKHTLKACLDEFGAAGTS